jgi:hypothetical protein
MQCSAIDRLGSVGFVLQSRSGALQSAARRRQNGNRRRRIPPSVDLLGAGVLQRRFIRTANVPWRLDFRSPALDEAARLLIDRFAEAGQALPAEDRASIDANLSRHRRHLLPVPEHDRRQALKDRKTLLGRWLRFAFRRRCDPRRMRRRRRLVWLRFFNRLRGALHCAARRGNALRPGIQVDPNPSRRRKELRGL